MYKMHLPALLLAALAAGCATRPATPVTVMPVADFASCAKPMYPRESLRHEHTGTVTLSFLVGQQGAVEASNIKTSSGHVLLDEAARAAIAQCRFKPGTIDGQPATLWMNMQYVWTLR